MKKPRNETLAEHLLNVDEDIMANAYEIDDAEKLRQFTKTKSARTKKTWYRSPAFQRIAVAAASFVLIIGIILSIPARPDRGNGAVTDEANPDPNYGEVIPPEIKGDEDAFTIDSIAQLNYYAAIRMIADAPTTKELTMSQRSAAKTALLSAKVDTDIGEDKEMPLPETTGSVISEGPVITPDPPELPDWNEVILYYELDPNEYFYINRVSFFQIELTDENGFLASELGLGTVDVVITEDCIWGESMITFRNGENFYSCLTNGGGYDRETGEWQWHFTTHKYVEGFYIVKNLAQENYGFRIKMDAQGQAYAFDCYETENGGEHIDQNVKVVGATEVSEEGRSFTVAELEAYFNTSKIPDENGSDETVDPLI
ncbi:MAG: hypothetical protein IJW46_07535 [Clostridia bacterium]|nr:hypothetical protein [Clostridia bacterium]